jgi:hypothetical protein
LARGWLIWQTRFICISSLHAHPEWQARLHSIVIFGAWLVDLADKIHLHLIAARASGMAGLAAFHGDNLWFLWTLQLCD